MLLQHCDQYKCYYYIGVLIYHKEGYRDINSIDDMGEMLFINELPGPGLMYQASNLAMKKKGKR